MNRIINVEPREGVLPWRARPSPETTIAELERAVRELDLEILKTEAFEIILVQTDDQVLDGLPPPSIQELADTMFGESDAVTMVEESGRFPVIDEGMEEIGDHADKLDDEEIYNAGGTDPE